MATYILPQTVKTETTALCSKCGREIRYTYAGYSTCCNALVRWGVRQPAEPPRPKPCKCEAYPFPHRAGGGLCGELRYCEHGVARAEDYCPECKRWEYADRAFDRARDSRLGV